MFTKKGHVDFRKSMQKVLDCKKDSYSRLKHLRQCFECAEFDARSFFASYHWDIYAIFFDTFGNLDSTLRHKGQKQAKEEQDCALFVFKKILLNCPDLLSRGWHQHSTRFVLQRLLHHGNSFRVRQKGVRLFLIWYQILGHAATADVQHMFASLVPGLVPEISNPFVNTAATSPTTPVQFSTSVSSSTSSSSFSMSNIAHPLTSPQIGSINTSTNAQPAFFDNTASRKKKRLPNGSELFDLAHNPVIPTEIEPLPIYNFDMQPRDATCFYLQIFLDYLVSQVDKICWEVNRVERQRSCFAFLFTKFKEVYLRHVFGSLDPNFSYYEPKFDLSRLSAQPLTDDQLEFPNKRFQHANTLLQCKAIVVKWLCRYLRAEQPDPIRNAPSSSVGKTSNVFANVHAQTSQSQDGSAPMSFDTTKGPSLDPNGFEYDLVFKMLTSNRDNVNLLHQVLGQVFRMPFTQSLTMRKVTMVYRDWIYRAFNRVPLFLQEPNEFSDSEKDSRTVAGGFSPFYRTFIIFSSNVFVQVLPDEEFSQLLDEQVEMCKRVLNIYRYMVMKVDMDRATWEQLLVVILQITSMVLPEQIPVKKEQTIGGRLAPAFFETLIVTWIRANLNIHVSLDMWNDFKARLCRLTKWEELIREWARTMDTLTRVMSRYVYNINLYDLPLERPVDRKQKRTTRLSSSPKIMPTSADPSRSSFPTPTGTAQDGNVSSTFRTVSQDHPNSIKNENSSDMKSSDSKQEHFSSAHHFLAQKCLSDTDLHQKKRIYSPESAHLPRPAQSILLSPVSGITKDSSKALSSSHSWRSKSLDNFDLATFGHAIDELVSEAASDGHSRSPSPTSSSNFENIHSLKEMQLHLDATSAMSGATSSLPNNEESGISSSNLAMNSNATNNGSSSMYPRFDSAARSVIAGGFYRNWSADSAIILWRRMLGILGDINAISNPHLHFIIMECLAKIIEDFIKIRENLCIISMTDSHSPVKQCARDLSIYPTLIPPMEYFVSWLFNATQLPDHYKGGKLIAYKLLCAIAIRRHEIALEKDFLSVFYLTIHHGLTSYDVDVISVIIKYCGAKLFSFNLQGASCLLYDFTDACKLILYSNETKRGMPRSEALCLLGTLIGMVDVYNEVSALNPNSISPILIQMKNHEEFILEILTNAVKREITSLGRAVAINGLAIYLYQQLSGFRNTLGDQILKMFDLLIIATQFPNQMLARLSSDALRLQCDHANHLVSKHPAVAKNIILGLIASIEFHMNNKSNFELTKDLQSLILNLLICLCDWCLVLPKQFLLQTCENQSETLLFCVFKLLHSLKRSDSRSFHDVSSATLTSNSIKGRVSIDFSICVDNLSDNMALNAKRRQDAAAHDSSTASFSTDISEDSGKALEVIRLCSSMLFNHLMNYVGHFPFAKVGPSRISCLVNEFDDNPKLLRTIDTNELNPDLFLAPNVLVMVVNGKSIVSFVDLGAECSDSVSQKDDPVDYLHRLGQVRIIVRDQIGKFAWNFTNLHSTFVESVDDGKQRPNITLPTASAYAEDDDFIYENTRPTDPLDNLMRHLNQFSPECIRRNSSFGPNSIDRSLDPAEENMIALLLNQHFQEMNYADKLSEMDQSGATEIDRISTDYHMKATKYRQNERHSQAPIDFMNSRKLIDQFGFLFWEKRRKLELLAKNDRVLRELRNLDKQKCRETHKIAVIYVKEGQEDKCSILSNQSASKEFEQFVSALGWEIDLARHDGFRGGLEENLSTGKTAPYFANAFYEIIFHVSTRMPNKPDPNTRLKGSNDSDLNRSLDVDAAEQGNEFINRKLRHLGNDEVHIVWSEHFRNYRRGIIPTEFCDVLIVIYPVQSLPGYYRVTIFRKNEIPFFGPLFNGAVVHLSVLGGLVRATAVNASRAQRSQVKFYQHYFQERFACLDKICSSQQDLKSFEQFSAAVYAPQQQPASSTGSSMYARPSVTVQGVKQSPKTSTNSKSIGQSSVTPVLNSSASKVLMRQAPVALRSSPGKMQSDEAVGTSRVHPPLVSQRSFPKSPFATSSKARPTLPSSLSSSTNPYHSPQSQQAHDDALESNQN